MDASRPRHGRSTARAGRRSALAALVRAVLIVAPACRAEPPVPPPAPEVDSSEQDGRFVGEIRARIGHPFAAVSAALAAPREWCAFAILHPNVKGCVCETSPEGERVTLYAGPKRGASLEDAYPIRYAFAAPVVVVPRRDAVSDPPGHPKRAPGRQRAAPSASRCCSFWRASSTTLSATYSSRSSSRNCSACRSTSASKRSSRARSRSAASPTRVSR